jgi:fructose-1,6-bisphosphatase I
MPGKFCVAFDPLDGSSNIDCNVSTGTIFAVWAAQTTAPATVADILRPGNEMVCAGYCMYGSATEMVITYGHGVHKFTLDPSVGEFIHSAANLTLPEVLKEIYSVNEGNYSTWDDSTQRAVDSFKFNQPKPYTARYVGSMVSDVHRTLMYGGIFMYPADKKTGKGKLRILYEGFPMAMIMEQAGGIASTGLFNGEIRRILDLNPANVHDRCPVIIGCERDVSRMLAFYDSHVSSFAISSFILPVLSVALGVVAVAVGVFYTN